MESPPSEINFADQKVLDDLNILLEKMDQCHTKLGELKSNATAIPKSNELYDIVGFLEACAPRMVELVEAVAQGNASLSDIVLMKALEVNDRLIKTLSDLDSITFVDAAGDVDIATSSQTDVNSDTIQSTTSEDEFDAFLSVRANNANDDLLS
jgi:hypothetical protein